MSNFSEISAKYEKDSIVQKSASDILFDLLDIQPNDKVLDLGCGTGYLTKLIKEKTNGKVVGIDPSDGMIEKANKKYSDQGILFHLCPAEQLDYENSFKNQSDGAGNIDLTFYRIYVLAKKMKLTKDSKAIQ
jgi:ubiquinone/menaquinone biosynthesis C-methylase UbiE